MAYSTTFIAALSLVMICSICWILLKLLKLQSPVVYGRHDSGEKRFGIPTRLSWIIMEAPACLVFAWFIFTGPATITAPVIVLFVMWQLHYFHRAFIYPFRLKVRAGSSTPIRMTLSGAFFCSLNGYLKSLLIYQTFYQYFLLLIKFHLQN